MKVFINDRTVTYRLENILDIAMLPETEIPKAIEYVQRLVHNTRMVMNAALIVEDAVDLEEVANLLGIEPYVDWTVEGSFFTRHFDEHVTAQRNQNTAN